MWNASWPGIEHSGACESNVSRATAAHDFQRADKMSVVPAYRSVFGTQSFVCPAVIEELADSAFCKRSRFPGRCPGKSSSSFLFVTGVTVTHSDDCNGWELWQSSGGFVWMIAAPVIWQKQLLGKATKIDVSVKR
jgi:hypothetical protein